MWIFLFSQEILGLPSLGFGWIESLTFPGGGRCVGVGVLGRCLLSRRFSPVGLSGFFGFPPWALAAVPSLGLVLVFFWCSFGCVVLPLYPRPLLWFLFPLLSSLVYTSTGCVRSGSSLLDAVPTPELLRVSFFLP